MVLPVYKYAQIKNGIVVNCIMSDDRFARSIRYLFDAVLRVDNLTPEPSIGWLYDGDFSPPGGA